MVYLSELTLDPRRRPTLRLLADTYDMHRALCWAFHEEPDRGTGRFLFRAESARGMARILVQSAKEPDWSRVDIPFTQLRGPKELCLHRPDGAPVFRAGQTLRYRLRANPTFRREGKRHAWVTRAEQCQWLERKGAMHGFDLLPIPAGGEWFDSFGCEPEARAEVRIAKQGALIGQKRLQDGSVMRIEHIGVDFDGVLVVTDPEKLAQAVIGGIGSGKAFGFGLLSLAAV